MINPIYHVKGDIIVRECESFLFIADFFMGLLCVSIENGAAVSSVGTGGYLSVSRSVQRFVTCSKQFQTFKRTSLQLNRTSRKPTSA